MARAEWQAAERETRRLEAASGRAASEASKLALERQAAASAVAAAEARISAASEELSLRRRAVDEARGRLAEEQRPVAALVAGLINLERRPPLLTLAGGGSVDELVRARALLAGTLPYVRARSRSLSAELASARRLEAEALKVAASVSEARVELARRQERFAALEKRALDRSSELGQAALFAGDEAIVAGAGFEQLGRQESERLSAARNAALLAKLPAATPRPFAVQGRRIGETFPYVLPATAAVIDGHGAVSATGIRSRGIRLATRRGSPVVMPAAGTIAFAGPYRRYDGVVIIDHGNGWMTMLLDVRTEARKGDRLETGAPLGIALGEMAVELSHQGNFVSPAEMAARSRSLSIQAQRR
ncbi:M23 family metallopeptidase [Sphingomonas sp. HDW15A]|uniref:murein hydrolase activator EnvC family protein n=1 Tax=Sphingomonas sp. HDW15A TaxID=2714942 RepID=UPI00140ACC2F|nr:M23 family metallopeptidase [Sphingomonas sp. HDW15A]QIK96686.1 M23 family metallopeptidase [Sphingomonas sp. HDW15A]